LTGLPRAAGVALATDPYTTVHDELPLPAVGEDDGLLRVEAAAVCGTDWEIYGRRTRGAGLGPLILGHETVGVVAAAGERAAERWGVAPGDRVAVEEFLPCGACRLCLAGHYRMCPATDSRGAGPFLRYGSTPVGVAPGLYGGFAEYLYLHPRAILHRVPGGVAPELAALYVPVANGIRWVRLEGGLAPGATLVVIGAGQHGLGCVVAGHQAGAGLTVAVDTARGRARLDAARALGADHVLEADRVDVVEAVAGLTGGAGADVVVDLAPGVPSTVADAVAMAATRGRVVMAASKHGQPVDGLQHDLVVRKELTLVAVRGHDHASVEAALATIASGRYPLSRLCTHRFGLDRAGDALRMAGERPDPAAIHVSVVPGQES
jgi:threonine dehydrogenase-like Zn-dependent dehydrogenase